MSEEQDMRILGGFDLQTQAHMLGMAAPGETVRFLSKNGYPHELDAAQDEFDDGERTDGCRPKHRQLGKQLPLH